MAFEPTVDSLDAVDENVRPFYRKAPDGKFNLITADSIDKLESALGNTKAERDAAKKAAAAAKAYEGLGKSAEEIQELLKADEERATKEAEKAGEWDKLKAQMAENHANELKKREDVAGRYKSALEKNMIDATATAAIAELKGVPALLLPHVRDRVRVEESDDGEFKAVVLTPDRKGPMLGTNNEPMTVRDLIASMREDEVYGRAFEGSGHSGGGGGPGGGGGGESGLKKSAMTIKEKTAYMQKHGSAAYAALPA